MTLEDVADEMEARWYSAPPPQPRPPKRVRLMMSERQENLARLVALVDRGIRGMEGE